MRVRSKRLLVLAAVLGLTALPAWGAGFTDLPDGAPRSVLALMLAERGILPGLSESEYGGTTHLSRYELASVLNALLDPRDVPFNVVAWSDIPPGHPAMPAVSRVTSLNLLEGEGGRYQGLRHVTRLEFVDALTHLLSYRSVSAPPRHKGPAQTFPDVSRTSASGQILDRAANFWQVVDVPRGGRFRPSDAVTRFEALDMLVRALLLLDPSMQEPIKAALALSAPVATPAPEPSPEPVVTPEPVRTPQPVRTPRPVATPEPEPTPRQPFWATPAPATPAPEATRQPFWATPEPATPAPSVAPSAAPTPADTPRPVRTSGGRRTSRSAELLTSRGRVGVDAVLFYLENGLQAAVPGLFNLNASGQAWMGELGGSGAFSTIYPIPVSGAGTNTSLFDFDAHGEALYKLPLRGPDWQLAGGAGVALHAINGTSALSATAFGLGPAGQLAYRMTPALTLQGALQLYPVWYESGQGRGALGFGSGWQLGGEYEVWRMGANAISASVYYHGNLGFGTGLETIHTLTFGAGGTF